MPKLSSVELTGCGDSHCACMVTAAAMTEPEVARINGVALHPPGERPSDEELLERAHTELLRQEAVRRGLLAETHAATAPELDDAARATIEAMLDDCVVTPTPDEDACRRHYEANRSRYVQGQALHVRHILFAVTPGVDIHALVLRAERVLLELCAKDVPPGRFEALAAELSNCPSGSRGGDLGWVTPEDCAPELANELFFQKHSAWGMGVHPRLVHTRFGLHIIEVLGRRKGRSLSFDEVHARIAADLAFQSRATALRQYIRMLAGAAEIVGVDLDGASTPLVQ